MINIIILELRGGIFNFWELFCVCKFEMISV